jgi:hypothetical protein
MTATVPTEIRTELHSNSSLDSYSYAHPFQLTELLPISGYLYQNQDRVYKPSTTAQIIFVSPVMISILIVLLGKASYV